MRPGFQPQPYVPRSANDPSFPSQNFHRSPQSKPVPYQHEPNSSYGHSHIFYSPTADTTPKKNLGLVKNMEERAEGPDSMMKKKVGKTDKVHHLKTEGSKEPTGHFDSSTKASDYSMKRDESEPDLRTSCPNIFRKFQHNTLRSTMQVNNYNKFGKIMADIKKHDDEEKNAKKPYYPHEPTTPGPRLETNGNFKKSVIDKPPFKLKTDLFGNKTAPKEKRNLVNGFDISKQLGKGKFGEVYLARHAETGFIVALKKIIKSKLKEYKMVEQFKREIRLHSALDHPNIVKFYGFFEHEDNIYLILEYISGGTLFDYMAEKDTLQPKEAAEYLSDTIEALSYMHDKSIAHRDIKPENIVLTVEKVAKLCDFGWSALVETSRTTYCGTFDYAPPEILERKNYDTGVDIWCIGVLTYEMLTGRVPFEGEKRKQIMEKIVSVDKNKIYYPVEVGEDAKSFIEWLVQKDPTQRPKCKELLKHPFFQNNLKRDKGEKKL